VGGRNSTGSTALTKLRKNRYPMDLTREEPDPTVMVKKGRGENRATQVQGVEKWSEERGSGIRQVPGSSGKGNGLRVAQPTIGAEGEKKGNKDRWGGTDKKCRNT